MPARMRRRVAAAGCLHHGRPDFQTLRSRHAPEAGANQQQLPARGHEAGLRCRGLERRLEILDPQGRRPAAQSHHGRGQGGDACRRRQCGRRARGTPELLESIWDRLPHLGEAAEQPRDRRRRRMAWEKGTQAWVSGRTRRRRRGEDWTSRQGQWVHPEGGRHACRWEGHCRLEGRCIGPQLGRLLCVWALHGRRCGSHLG
mmetsp:Transcript_23005/g.64220  ORF Transcript_23005/g.64220 Transcript_23005/m.64220 type:complete len:201 (-) Transcript_23005:137-739(-)